MHSRSRPSIAFAAIALVGVLAGCALVQPPSPTTIVTGPGGQQVELSWADYPGEPYIDPADVLAAPRAEQAEEVGELLLDDLQRAVDAHAPGLAWERADEGGVFEHDGNGYGGATMHRTSNSAGLWVAQAPDDWPALSAALDTELARHGFDAIVWDFDRAPLPQQSQAERDADVVAQHGSLDPSAMWLWAGAASRGAEWVSVVLSDVDRGVGAPEDASSAPQQQLAITVGATVISEVDEDAYSSGISPFDDLQRPSPTHSD